MNITSTEPPFTARRIAEQLLLAFDSARSLITLPVIESLRQLVDETKHQDPKRALQIAETAILAAAWLADPIATAHAAWAKATAQVFLFELQAAQENYRIAERIFAQEQQLHSLVGVQAPLVYVLNALGEQDAALALAEAVRPRCHALGEEGLAPLVNLEMNVGTIYIQQGRYAESLAACDRASRAAHDLGDQAALGRIDINRANVFQELDRYVDAAQCYQRARKALLESKQNRQQVALVDLNLGLLALRRGDYWQSLQHLEAARAGFVSAAHIAWVDFNRALVYHRLNLNAETVQMAASAVAELRKSGSNREVAMALQVWANALEKQGAPQEAEQLLKQAHQLFSEQSALVMAAQVELAQAELALRRQQVDQARAYLAAVSQSVKMQSIPSFAAQADLIAAELDLNDTIPQVVSALSLIEQAIARITTSGQSSLLLRAVRLRGRALTVDGQVELAKQAYAAALAISSELRRTLLIDELQIAFFEEHLPIFMDAVALAVQSNDSPAAVAKILALAATTPAQHQTIEIANLSQTEQSELQRLRNDWHWQQSKVEKFAHEPTNPEWLAAQKILSRIEVQIADHWRRVGARVGNTDRANNATLALQQWRADEYAKQLQRSLTDDEAYLHFFVIGEQIYALLATPRQLFYQPLGATSAVDAALRAWRHHLRDWGLIGIQPELAKQIAARSLVALYRALFTPLVETLLACHHLYLLLPSQWSDLPVAALLEGGRSLIERWSFSQLVSPLSLIGKPLPLPQSGASKHSHHALLIGMTQAAGLTQSAAELRRIAALAPASWSHELLLDSAATQAHFVANVAACDLLHIASHATFRADNPLFSWLQLADGRMTVAELYQRVRFKQRPLTVLSACETARGQHSGLLGVARALLATGAGELVATKWKVEDKATAQLMAAFYKSWFGNGLLNGDGIVGGDSRRHTATALAHAQRLLAGDLHPVYWAGFVQIW